jgi:TFIIH p62 subunit, N-terminal domain
MSGTLTLPTDSRDTKVYDVVYRGEPGRLTLTSKTFHYQADHVDAAIKCSWARVEKRQLSPPSAPTPLLKLVLVSGRTVVFEVASLRQLLELVKTVKDRMEANAPAAPEQAKNDDDYNNNNNNNNKSKAAPTKNSRMRYSANTEFMDTSDVKQKKGSIQRDNENENENGDIEDANPKAKPPISPTTKSTASDSQQQRRSSTGSQPPPVLTDQDEFLSQAHDKRNDSRRTLCYCPWDSVWCWLCLALFLAIVGLIVTLIVLFGLDNNNTNTIKHSSKPLCKDTASDTSKCPPDSGLEELYGIRSVEYVWAPDFVRLEYYISDYILNDSINLTVLDGVDCRGSDDQIVPLNNSWLKSELVDGAPVDGGANLYNEGKGTRQFDVVLQPIAGSDLTQAPFYTTNTANVDKAFLRVCVVFQIFYNKIDGFTESVEVRRNEMSRETTLRASWGI